MKGLKTYYARSKITKTTYDFLLYYCTCRHSLYKLLLLPALEQRQVKEVDYGTFMTMIDEKQIDSVNIESNQIIFTDKSGDTVYKTGIIEDPDLVTRLHESGAKFHPNH